ncbi:MAG: flagellar basal body rod protein FlgB [Deltaproteobacteria bacterium]|nr:flagellar basal body rod protein FlgB [Deltaproteobacteria bacterium]
MIVPPEALFNSTILMLEKLLDFQSERHSILSTNVANIDTPGYKGHDLRFSDELKKAAGRKGSMPLTKTNERHLPLEIGNIKGGRLVPINDAVHRLDGNTVDLDKEMAKLAENSLYYNTAAQITSKKLRGILTAISEVR